MAADGRPDRLKLATNGCPGPQQALVAAMAEFSTVLAVPSNLPDPLDGVRALATQKAARDAELRRSFADLETKLRDAVSGSPARASSDNCTMEVYGDDEAVYGYLFFDGERLRVAHRTTEDDLLGSLDRYVDPDGPTFTLTDHSNCSIAWLQALAVPSVVSSLLIEIDKAIREMTERSDAGVRTLSTIASIEIRNLDTALESVASVLAYPAVVDNWKKAQAAINIDPSDATTRACQLVETVCKHIHATLAVALPSNQSVQHLLKSVARALQLSPDLQTSHDLQMMASGMLSAVAGIGALRTHVGTAHGSSPERHSPTPSEARFAVNCAGATATFLMDTLANRKPPPRS